jgi:hypothetical protein
MSRYQLFQQWWARATSGPSDFRINKRSAEIGFNAALDLEEQNSDSPASPVQQLKAEIRSVVDDFVTVPPTRVVYEIDGLVQKLRELSAI